MIIFIDQELASHGKSIIKDYYKIPTTMLVYGMLMWSDVIGGARAIDEERRGRRRKIAPDLVGLSKEN